MAKQPSNEELDIQAAQRLKGTSYADKGGHKARGKFIRTITATSDSFAEENITRGFVAAATEPQILPLRNPESPENNHIPCRRSKLRAGEGWVLKVAQERLEPQEVKEEATINKPPIEKPTAEPKVPKRFKDRPLKPRKKRDELSGAEYDADLYNHLNGGHEEEAPESESAPSQAMEESASPHIISSEGPDRATFANAFQSAVPLHGNAQRRPRPRLTKARDCSR